VDSEAAEPLARGLDYIYYWVADMDRALGFYRDVLGLQPSRPPNPGWTEFDLDGQRFALHGAVHGEHAPPTGGTVAFRVERLDAARAWIERHGVPIVHEGEVGSLARFLSVLDPDGNAVDLIEYTRSS
jgi:catechol 2,3-dioxygenase-like lactoylglutathione lyase family enzyme